MAADSNIATRVFSRISRIFGIERSVDLPHTPDTISVDGEIRTTQFSLAEVRNLPGIDRTSNATYGFVADNNNTNTDTYIGYLTSVSEDSRRSIKENRSLITMTPEICQCERITVSAILSPTDSQTDMVNITVDVKDISPEVCTRISNLLTSYFNDELGLGPNLYRWISTALYRDGAQAILVLPKSNIKLLNNAVDLSILDRSNIISDIDKGDPVSDTPSVSNTKLIGSNEYLSVYNGIDDFIMSSAEDVIFSMEELSAETDVTKDKIAQNLANGVSSLIKESQKNIIISHNALVLGERFIKGKSLVSKIQTDLDKYFLGDRGNQMMILSEEFDKNDNDNQPAVIEVPTEAVVPVCVPGCKSEHLGYFILADQWGAPITPEAVERINYYGSKQLTQSSLDATFGRNLPYLRGNDLNYDQRFNATAAVFGATMRNLLEHNLQECGFEGATISRYNSLATCMFHYLMQKQRVNLVFVPESLMVYYRYDHRDDGTGKSLLEDISFILALRTTLVIAGVMAAIKNSIDRKVIEFNVDEKNNNLEGSLDMVRNIFTEKAMYRFDNDPITVARDIIDKSLVIVPKGIRGIAENLNVTSESRGYNAIQPDQDLIEKLTNWGISGLGTPHSALNALSETEYSRSVAITNTYYANIIRSYQRTSIQHTNKFLRNYIKYSYPIQEAILRELSGDSKYTHEEVSDASEDSSNTIKHNTDTSYKNLLKVIKGVKLVLPTPNVAASKAQYGEVNEFIDMVNNIMSKIFDEALVTVKDKDEVVSVFGAIKAMMTSKIIREYINNIGFGSILQVPELDSFEPTDVTEFNIKLLNFKKRLNIMEQQLTPQSNDNSDNSGSNW